ncbi:MAG: right-handed parallel beta-helix repeat-containing protein [Planctomycetaceae bacterium]|jgi:hypothetical protein|nr:right-handed parallel beta-helix repeat-containing protein [Planctomycetaceae bacterium]
MINIIFFIVLLCGTVQANVLEIGTGKPFQKIEEALKVAEEGDTLVIHPHSDGSPYRQPALLVRTSKITIRSATPDKPVVLDGTGFEYSGRGLVPRAIIQFDPDADGCTVEGLTLINARNKSFNGAGVRINQANNITVRRCVIQHNDMGIMSNGKVADNSGAEQMIEFCTVADNGTKEDPGYNHNLYLGGTSATVKDCTIARSVTGHNLKSRAHRNRIIHNRIEHSANRELDIVDEKGNTDVPDSDCFVIDNVIVKDPKCTGNRAVIHFGFDGNARRDGTLRLTGNTIITPFISPVADVNDGHGAEFINNKIDDNGTGQKGVLVLFHSRKMILSGKDNVVPKRFGIRYTDSDELLPLVWK